MGDCTTDCRSEVGVTVGLIDGLIAIARVLAQRDLSPAEAQEALADLRADEDMARVLGPNAPVKPALGARLETGVRRLG